MCAKQNAVVKTTGGACSMLAKQTLSDIVDIEKSEEICLSSFVADKFSALFLHQSVFCIKHSRSA